MVIGMKKNRIYHTVISREKYFYISVVLLEIVTYTFSFIVSGLAKKDIFNLLEGSPVTMGIYSFPVLIGLNVAIPLLINCVKQVNAGLAAKLEVRFRRNIKQNLYENVFQEKLGTAHERGYGEIVSLFRNECEDLVSYLMEYYYQLSTISLSIAILIVMVSVNPFFAVISIVPTFGMVFLIKYLEKRIVANRRAARQSTGEITEYLENMFAHIEYFKLAADSDKLAGIFEEKCRKRAGDEVKDRVLDKALSGFSENSAGVVMGIVLLTAIPLYRRNVLSVGEFVMFEYYYAFLASLPDAVGRLVRRHKQSMVSIHRLQMPASDSYKGDAVYSQGVLRVDVECPGRVCEIKAHDGEVILIRGGNESERSMVLQRLFQVCIDCLSEVSCKYVSGQPVLMNDSVVNNICFGEPYSEECMNRVLAETDLRTEEILISNILEQTEKIIFVASDSVSMLEKATQIVNV